MEKAGERQQTQRTEVLPEDKDGEVGASSSQKNETLPEGREGEKTKKKSIPLQSFKAFCDRTYIPGDTFRYIFQKNLEIHWTYVYYRLAITVAHGTCLVISVLNLFSPCPPNIRIHCITGSSSLSIAWPFYFTSWGLILNFSQSTIGLALTIRACRSLKTSQRQNSVPQFLKTKKEHNLNTLTGFYWALNSVSSVLALIITIVYWSLLYNYSEPATLNLINGMAEHLFNLIWITVDRCLVAFPAMTFHGVLLLPIGFFYIIASLSYFAAGGLDQSDKNDYLYSFVNWHYPGMAVLSIILLNLVAVLLVLPMELADRFKHKKFRPPQIHEAYENMRREEV